MPDDVIQIPIDRIYPPYILLRTIAKQSLAYLELLESIKEEGVLNSICVRKSPRKEGWYEIIDGMRRWNCSKDAGFKTIPAIVKEADDVKVLMLQLQANAIQDATKPIAYATRLKQILLADPKMNFSILAKHIKKSPDWIKKTLGLLSLTPNLCKRVDRCEIALTSAYMLAKLPKYMQEELEEDAIIMPSKPFCEKCAQLLLEYRNQRLDIKRENFYRGNDFAHPYLQLYRVLVAEWKHLAVGPTLLVRHNVTKPLDAWKLAMAWVLHMDPESIEEQRKRALKRLELEHEAGQTRQADRQRQQDAAFIKRLE